MVRKPFFWFLPLTFFLGLFYLYPILDVLRLSFTDATLLAPATSYSFSNFVNLLTSGDFYQILRITFLFVGFSLLFQMLLGLGIALLLNRGQERGLIGTTLTRTIVLSAWIIPGVAIGIIWKIILSGFPYGVANFMLQSAGLGKLPFLYSPFWALVSVTVANIWRGTAFSMLLQYSGLQQIPNQLYESAKVDGASVFQSFRYITLPQLKSFIYINLVLATIYTFNTFDMIISLTGGGPGKSTEVLALHAYSAIFDSLNLGRGTAIAVILLVLNLAFSLIYYNRMEVEGG